MPCLALPFVYTASFPHKWGLQLRMPFFILRIRWHPPVFDILTVWSHVFLGWPGGLVPGTSMYNASSVSFNVSIPAETVAAENACYWWDLQLFKQWIGTCIVLPFHVANPADHWLVSPLKTSMIDWCQSPALRGMQHDLAYINVKHLPFFDKWWV